MSAIRQVVAPRVGAPVLAVLAMAVTAAAQSTVHSFTKQQLSKEFLCEGATFGDLDRDGHADVIAGPYWYTGPKFEERHEIYPPKPFDKQGYSDNFFAFVHDFDGDGWNDILFVGFPGQDASWFRNPQKPDAHWQRHVVFDVVDNESPTWTDIDGDGKPELVCQFEDRLGYAKVDWADPAKKWQWHPISVVGIGGRFTHGLGVGDVDGDGRVDILWKHGWWRQPDSLAGDPEWQNNPVKFATAGGAQMLVYDIDGDGDNDVVTSENAHGFGLWWHEQRRDGDKITFAPHLIMGSKAADNPYGVVIGNLHALCAVDMNDDGLIDIVTGNRYWAHGGKERADAVDPSVSWFQLRRVDGVVSWGPHEIDGNSGVGTQVVAGDVDGDGTVDVVVGNKMGTFVHRHAVRQVSSRERTAIERRELRAMLKGSGRPRGVPPKAADGRVLNLDFEAGDLRDWTPQGDAFAQVAEGDAVFARRSDMRSGHTGRFWVGSYEQKRSDEPRGTLTSATFVLDRELASFLVGGGSSSKTRVEIVRADTGAVVSTTSGNDDEEMRPAKVDLHEHVGKPLFIRLVDDATDGWGHLNFDDFQVYSANEKEGGFPAEEAVQRMDLPEGFHTKVFASEPDVRQPIAMAIDERGRVWVAEAFSYPRRQPEGQGHDRILVFEDHDGDGKFDKRTVFYEGLNLVSGMEVGYGGVFVGAAPNLLFLPDANGDLVPDGEPQVLLDGWHYEDTHETLNAFTWGPDGWLYGCHGVFTDSRVGKPGTPDDQRTPIDAGVWRYQPLTHEFEVFAYGTSNPWGIDFDDRGQAFITACVIPHLYHIIEGGLYRRQSGPHFNRYAYDDIRTIADHLHYVGRNPHDGNQLSDAVGGGHAHCGAMIYRGGRWPAPYAGSLFMNNIHGHRLNMDVLRREGSGYAGGHGADLLVSHDTWWMAVAFDYGPDGNVYLIDWYDQQSCHDSEMEKWDRSNGRIYKICYGDDVVAPIDLAAKSDAELVPFVFDANEFYARRARRLLTQRQAIATAPQLAAVLADTGADEPKRLRALWALHGVGGLDDARLLALLGDPAEYVRAWAIQFAVEDRAATHEQLAKFAALAQGDPSPVVRLYLASAMQRLPHAERWAIAEGLVAHAEDAEDHNLPLMVWFGIEPALPGDPARAMALAQGAKLPRILEFTVRRLTEAGGAAAEAVATSLGAAKVPADAAAILEPMQVALKRLGEAAMPAAWPAARARVETFGDAKLHEAAMWVGAMFGDQAVRPELARLAADPTVAQATRDRAFELLAASHDAATAPLVRNLVDDPQLGERAVRALAQFEDAGTPSFLLGRWQAFDAKKRAAAVATMCGRAAWAKELLGAVKSGGIDKELLDAPTRLQLTQLGDPELEQRLTEVWGRSVAPSAATSERLAALKKKLTPEALAEADVSNGRAVFGRTCMVCHRLFGTGTEFAPDLTGSNRKNLDYILTNILDPNAEVTKQNMMTTVRLKSGNVVMGLIADETDTSLTVRSQVGSQVVAKRDVDKLDRLEISMMPPGQLDGMSEADQRDLIAYLGSDHQVPMRASAANQGLFFNGGNLAMWDANPELWSVEDGELVGRTKTGIGDNDFAKSHLLVRDFELTFEIKLVGDQGNSGVQFRSAVQDNGHMKGLQADVGPGWWGKLYDELGRGVLVGDDHDALVKKGDWNRYRIVAEGSHVRTWINDQPCVDFDDRTGPREGVIGLQLHSGGPTEVRFRNLALTVK